MKSNIYSLLLCTLILTACSKQISPLENALNLSESNRIELEKVLNHYSEKTEDSLKYKAAEFLIENMVYHHTYSGNDMEDYYKNIEKVFLTKNGSRKEMNEYLNTIQSTCKKTFLPDIKSVTSEYLISHIDHAFKTQAYPWTKHVSFDDFCEYVLPYRLEHEPIESWGALFQEHLKACIDSLIEVKASDTLLCSKIITHLDPAHFTLIDYSFIYKLKPSLLLKMNAGTCNELSHLGIFALRSIGLPAVYDFTPQWANRILGHNWSAIKLNGENYTFQIDDNVPFGQHLPSKVDDKLAKVYRKMYSIQKESLTMQNIKEEIPSLFHSPYLKDVSDIYFDGINIEVTLTIKPPVKRKLAYIMAFNNMTWKPLAWSKISGNKAIFPQMNKDCAYLVMYYYQNKFHPASAPFYIDKNGNMKLLEPDATKKREVTLKRKYPNFDIGILKDRMPGGKFQIANKADFSDSVTIHTIGTLQDLMPQYIKSDTILSCKYFRYLSSDKGHVFLAELELYDKEGMKITGDIIGTEGCFSNNGLDKYTVFDGDVLSYFDAPETAGCWVGLAFNEIKHVKEFMYIPRNNDNYIQPGEQYELFYFDREFISLGTRTGDKSHILTYKDVPDNALLLLRNHTKGMQERIFTYENNKQIWW